MSSGLPDGIDEKLDFAGGKTRYGGECQNCGRESDTLYDFRGRGIICWNCIKEDRTTLSELSAEKLRELIRSDGHGHPIEVDEPYWRMEIIDEIETRGKKLLENLGMPADMDALYRNLHTGSEYTLGQILSRSQHRQESDIEIDWHNLFDVVEHHKPAEGKNIEKIRYRADKEGCKPLDDF